MCGVVNKNVNLCYHCYLLMFDSVPFVGLALYVLMYSRNVLEDPGLFKSICFIIWVVSVCV